MTDITVVTNPQVVSVVYPESPEITVDDTTVNVPIGDLVVDAAISGGNVVEVIIAPSPLVEGGGGGGEPGLVWRGPWDGSTAYLVDDAVERNGSSYVAIAPSTNQAPPNVTYWNLLAAKGATGAGGGGGGSSSPALTVALMGA